MEVLRQVNENLEAQLEQYNKLLVLANQKSELLAKPSASVQAQELRSLVKGEVTVVSLLEELERSRVKICEGQPLEQIVQTSETKSREAYLSVRDRLKKVASEIRARNALNQTVIQFSLKLVHQMMRAIQELNSTQELTYSRIKRKGSDLIPSTQGLSIKV